MRVSVIVTDDDGNTFAGEAELVASGTPAKASRPKVRRETGKSLTNPSVSFSSPIRAFVKNHARGMGGAQKFALLLAYLTKGDPKTQLPLAEIQKQWGKMKSLLGKWTRAHTIRAKEYEWVDSPKTGMYVLLPGWKEIFNA